MLIDEVYQVRIFFGNIFQIFYLFEYFLILFFERLQFFLKGFFDEIMYQFFIDLGGSLMDHLSHVLDDLLRKRLIWRISLLNYLSVILVDCRATLARIGRLNDVW